MLTVFKTPYGTYQVVNEYRDVIDESKSERRAKKTAERMNDVEYGHS